MQENRPLDQWPVFLHGVEPTGELFILTVSPVCLLYRYSQRVRRVTCSQQRDKVIAVRRQRTGPTCSTRNQARNRKYKITGW